MPNLTNHINTQVSAEVVKFTPGGAPASFVVTVVNESDQFASFHLEIEAHGADVAVGSDWYALTPEVSTKKPPGDRTQFTVSITDTPVPGFVGTMNLTVRIFSLELRQEERQLVRLVIEPGLHANLLQVTLPVEEFQAHLGELVEIPVQVVNPGQPTANVEIRLLGINPAWFVDGNSKRLQLNRQGKAEVTFICQPPQALRTISQTYPFTVEATLRSYTPVRASGQLDVLPSGVVEFSCNPSQQRIPGHRRDLPTDTATFALQLQNASNLRQQIDLAVQPDVTLKAAQTCKVQLSLDQVEMNPAETSEVQLTVRQKRPRWGFPYKLLLELTAQLSDPRVELRDATQTVEVEVLPLIPAWLQVAGGALLLTLIALLALIRPQGHQDAVNTVRFNGQADQVVSGSNDQTLRTWHVGNGRSLKPVDVSESAGKAVRVIRYRPVNNNVAAIGLENGEIQLIDLLSRSLKPLSTLLYRQDDRVFDLTFTPDSRYLFSGHGSGAVLQWDLEGDGTLDAPQQPIRRQQLDFAVTALTLLGRDRLLAVGGRYDRLLLWDWAKNQRHAVPYRQTGGQDDYILSLATAEHKPYLLASADNQGYITLWDTRACFTALKENCEVQLDQWRTEDGNNAAVRSLAFSSDGCYLASGGDNGRVMLWPLNADHQRDRRSANGLVVGRSTSRINAVDVAIANDTVQLVSGDGDHQVNRYQVPDRNNSCP
jgi:WD40 repeat protein